MWIRKSELEIKEILRRREQKKKSLVRPIVIGIVFGLLFMLIYSLGYRGGLSRGVVVFSSPTSLFDFKNIFAGVFGFGLFFGLAFYHQRRGFGFLSNEETLLCSSCYEPLSDNETKTCHCGGKLEPYDFFVWNEPVAETSK
jgi:hypothetical protein